MPPATLGSGHGIGLEPIWTGMNPQHAIVSGGGAQPADSVGFPFNARYTIASGNLLADFRYNVTAESMGRLQVTRLFALTGDRGVRDMLRFNLVLSAGRPGRARGPPRGRRS
jgi:Mn-containing catalase